MLAVSAVPTIGTAAAAAVTIAAVAAATTVTTTTLAIAAVTAVTGAVNTARTATAAPPPALARPATTSAASCFFSLDPSCRHSAVAVAVVKLHVVRAVAVVLEDPARVKLLAALAPRLHPVAKTQLAGHGHDVSTGAQKQVNALQPCRT